MSEKKIIELEIKDKGMAEFGAKATSLRTQLKEMKIALAGMGEGTAEFNKLNREAGRLQDKISDLNRGVKAFASDTRRLDIAVGGVQLAAGAFGAVTASAALFGGESEELQKTMMKLQGALTLVTSVQAVATALTEKSAFMTALLSAKTKVQIFFTGLQTAATTTATVATRTLNVAMMALPIVAIAAGITALVAGIYLFSKGSGAAAVATQALKDTLDDYKKGATEAILKTNEVKTAFEMARNGTISKEQALKTYNDTLGDSFGKMTNVNDAEKVFIAKEKAFIESTAKRAQAQALFVLAAEQTAKGLTANLEDHRSFGEKTLGVVTDYMAGYTDIYTFGLLDLSGKADKIQGDFFKKAQDNEKKVADNKAKIIGEQAKKAQKEAGKIEKDAGIKDKKEIESDADKATRKEAAAAKAKTAREKAAAEQKAADEKAFAIEKERLANIAKLESDFLDELETQNTDFENRQLSEQDRELQAVNDKYFNLIETAKQYNLDTLDLELQQKNDLNDINVKFAQEELALSEAKALKDKETADKEIQLALDVKNAKVQMASDAIGALSDLVTSFAGKDEASQKRAFKINKAASVAQAVISTYQAANAAMVSPANNLFPGHNIIMAGIAVAAGLANVAKIAKTQFEGGGGGSLDTPTAPGGSGGVNAPNFNVVGNSGINQLGQLQQQPIQAYVVSGEMTTQQALDRNRLQNATL